MTDYPPIQDTITLVLTEQKIIVHETVRVNVAIDAQVDPAINEADFRAEIQSTLRKFIDTDWKIQSIQRYKGNKYENVSVAATARVAETENHRLQERADALTRIGFELNNPTVDYSLTFEEIQAVNAELRLNLLKKALAETNAINKIFREVGIPGIKQIFRLSNSRFDTGQNTNISNAYAPLHLSELQVQYSGSSSPKIMAQNASPIASGGSGDGSYDDTDMAAAGESLDLNVSTRFSMTGSFVLSHLVPLI